MEDLERNGQGVFYDFAANLSLAEKFTEATVIDFARRRYRKYLVDGWSLGEVPSYGPKFVWAEGRSSKLLLRVEKVCDRQVTLHCGPFVYQGSRDQLVKVWVNENPLQELVLRRRSPPSGYHFSIPASFLRYGDNILRFEFAHTASPADVLSNNPDKRQLAAWFDRLEIRSGEASSRTHRLAGFKKRVSSATRSLLGLVDDTHEGKLKAQAPIAVATVAVGDHSRRAICQPGPSTINFYLELPESPRLRFAYAIDVHAGENTSDPVDLTIVVEPWRGEPEVVFSDSLEPVSAEKASWREREVDLSAASGRIARISFLASDMTYWGLPLLLGNEEGSSEAEWSRQDKDQTEAATTENRPPVILYVIDALRPDHLSYYGYGRPTSPYIDQFAAEATVFDNAFAHATMTLSSVPNMLRGAYTMWGLEAPKRNLPTLATRLKTVGYETVAFNTNVLIDQWHPYIGQEFDHYAPFGQPRDTYTYATVDVITPRVIGWLRQARRDSVFLWVHTMDVHGPYEPSREMVEALQGGPLEIDVDYPAFVKEYGSVLESDPEKVFFRTLLYDAEILFNDKYFGAFIDFLKRIGLYEEAIIVLTSDHGEEFFEHGFFSHGLGTTLCDHVLRVPLMVRVPGQKVGRRVSSAVGHTDLAPTILDLLGVEIPAYMEGRNFASVLRGEPEPPSWKVRTLFAYEGRLVQKGSSQAEFLLSGRRGKWKLVNRAAGRSFDAYMAPPLLNDVPLPVSLNWHALDRLYNLEADPEETVNLADKERVMTGFLRQQALEWFERQKSLGGPGEKGKPLSELLDDEKRETLRALGYLK